MDLPIEHGDFPVRYVTNYQAGSYSLSIPSTWYDPIQVTDTIELHRLELRHHRGERRNLRLCKDQPMRETEQGLVTVPFWVYWTSPYSSHYRPYTQWLGDVQWGHLMTHAEAEKCWRSDSD